MDISCFVLFLCGSVTLVTSCSRDGAIPGNRRGGRFKKDRAGVEVNDTRSLNGTDALSDTKLWESEQKQGPIKRYLCKIITKFKKHYRNAAISMQKMQAKMEAVDNELKGVPTSVDLASDLEREAQFQKEQASFFKDRVAFHERQVDLCKNHSSFLRQTETEANQTNAIPMTDLEMSRRIVGYHKAQLDLHRKEYRQHTKRLDFIANQTAEHINQKDLLDQLKKYHNYLSNYHANEFEYHVSHYTEHDAKLRARGSVPRDEDQAADE